RVPPRSATRRPATLSSRRLCSPLSPDTATSALYTLSLHDALPIWVRTTPFSHGIRLTVSIGVASYPSQAASKEQLIRLADAMAYAAKRSGKDRVMVASVRSPSPPLFPPPAPGQDSPGPEANQP